MSPIDSPPQVRNAFVLLWASLAIATLESVIALFVPGFSEEELGNSLWWFLSISFVLLAANAYLIYCASRRKNWARVVLLVVTVLIAGAVVFAYLVWPSEWGEEDWWSSATSMGCTAMEAIALFWLFTGAGAKWYTAKMA